MTTANNPVPIPNEAVRQGAGSATGAAVSRPAAVPKHDDEIGEDLQNCSGGALLPPLLRVPLAESAEIEGDARFATCPQGRMSTPSSQG